MKSLHVDRKKLLEMSQKALANAEEAVLANEVAFQKAFQECLDTACQDYRKGIRKNSYNIQFMRTETPDLEKMRAANKILAIGSEDSVEISRDDYFWKVIQELSDPKTTSLNVQHSC